MNNTHTHKKQTTNKPNRNRLKNNCDMRNCENFPAEQHRRANNTSGFVNPLPDDKILDWSKLKQIADNI